MPLNPFGGFANKVKPVEPVLTIKYFWNSDTRTVGFAFPRPVPDVHLTEIQLAQHIECLQQALSCMRTAIELTEKPQVEVKPDPEGRTP